MDENSVPSSTGPSRAVKLSLSIDGVSSVLQTCPQVETIELPAETRVA